MKSALVFTSAPRRTALWATHFLLVVVALFGLACKKNSEADSTRPYQQQGENFKFFTSASLHGQSLSNRSETFSAPFEIKEVKAIKDSLPLRHDFLRITLEHSKTCNRDFEVIWDGTIFASFPGQVYFLLKHNDNCTPSAERTTTVVNLDLDQFTDTPNLIDGTIFHVVNTSKRTAASDLSVNSSNQ